MVITYKVTVVAITYKSLIRPYTIFSVKTTGWYYTEDGISFYRNVCKIIANILAIIFLLRLCKVGNLWFGKGL